MFEHTPGMKYSTKSQFFFVFVFAFLGAMGRDPSIADAIANNPFRIMFSRVLFFFQWARFS